MRVPLLGRPNLRKSIKTLKINKINTFSSLDKKNPSILVPGLMRIHQNPPWGLAGRLQICPGACQPLSSTTPHCSRLALTECSRTYVRSTFEFFQNPSSRPAGTRPELEPSAGTRPELEPSAGRRPAGEGRPEERKIRSPGLKNRKICFGLDTRFRTP